MTERRTIGDILSSIGEYTASISLIALFWGFVTEPLWNDFYARRFFRPKMLHGTVVQKGGSASRLVASDGAALEGITANETVKIGEPGLVFTVCTGEGRYTFEVTNNSPIYNAPVYPSRSLEALAQAVKPNETEIEFLEDYVSFGRIRSYFPTDKVGEVPSGSIIVKE